MRIVMTKPTHRGGPRGSAWRLTCLLIWLLAFAGLALAGEPEPEHEHKHPAAPLAVPLPAQSGQSAVGVDEKLGEFIPGDIVLRNESGAQVNLKDLVKLPTLLVPVYYSCPNDCNLLLGQLSQILPQVALTPGREFQVITFSFDETDTPEVAARRKNDFFTALTASFPPEDWMFLSGDRENILKLTQALGFNFKRDGKAFQHSVITVALSPTGKITRYLYGSSPLPFDLTMAATEAAGETTGLSVKRAIGFCYSYDPAGRRYVFDIMKMSGITVLCGLAVFFLFLIFGGKKRKPGKHLH